MKTILHFIGACCVLASTYALAQSSTSASPCDSIAGAAHDCGATQTPQVIAKGAQIEVRTIRKGVKPYPLTPERRQLLDEMGAFEHSCLDRTCTCEEDVKYPVFRGDNKGLKIINQREFQQARDNRCSFESAHVRHIPKYIHTSPALISIAIYELDYCRGCGGSCHGGTTLTTYNAKTGAIYTLNNVVDSKDLPSLRENLYALFLKANSSVETDEEQKQALVEQIALTVTEQSGIYVENGRVYVDLNTFILGCVGGSFYPFQIPERFIKPEFLNLVHQ